MVKGAPSPVAPGTLLAVFLNGTGSFMTYLDVKVILRVTVDPLKSYPTVFELSGCLFECHFFGYLVRDR